MGINLSFEVLIVTIRRVVNYFYNSGVSSGILKVMGGILVLLIYFWGYVVQSFADKFIIYACAVISGTSFTGKQEIHPTLIFEWHTKSV